MTLTLEQLRNLTLDDVVGRRDLARVRLATPEEVSALSGPIGEGPNRGTLMDWRLIAIDVQDGPLEVVLLGNLGDLTWGTSIVRAVDFDSGRARTRSGSVYQLGEAGEGEPQLEHVLHMCVLLRHWGLGAALGIPEVFY